MKEKYLQMLDDYIKVYMNSNEVQLTKLTNDRLILLKEMDEATLIELLAQLNNKLNSSNNTLNMLERSLYSAKKSIDLENIEEYCRNLGKTRAEAIVEYNNYCKKTIAEKNEVTKTISVLKDAIYNIKYQLDRRLENLTEEEKEIVVSRLNDIIQKKEFYIETLGREIASRNLKLGGNEEINRMAEVQGVSIGDIRGKLMSEVYARELERRKEQDFISFYNEYIEQLSVSKKL